MIAPVTLKGQYVTLVPLTQDHCQDLQEAVQEGDLWKLWYVIIPSPEKMSEEIVRRLELQAQGTMLPFAVIHNETKKAVGMTTYCRIDEKNKQLDIGWTWYRKSMQKTAVNTECKLLLLKHAFENLNCIVVRFKVHFFNHASRRAVERLGARLDGIWRNFSIMPDGQVRDVCDYSILPHEWPNVKKNLEFRLRKI